MRRLRPLVFAAVVGFAVAAATIGAARQAGQGAGRENGDGRAASLHREAIVVDTHIDTTAMLMRPGWRFDERHPAPARGGGITSRDGNHVDLPRMREGGLDAAFFSIYIPGTITGPEAVRRARAQIDRVRELVRSLPKDLALAVTAEDVRSANADGKVAVLMGVEGGHMINEDLGVLRDFARLGVRYLTLTHGVNTPWADSSTDKPVSNGLTRFGKEVVRELNRLGVLVDVSHVSDKTFWDALEVSEAPLIASHSSCRALSSHARNMTDEMIKAMARRGGVIQVNFMTLYLDQLLLDEQERRQPAFARLREELERRYPGPENEARRSGELQAARLESAASLPQVSWEKIVDHIDHAVKVAGVDHVGLGSDFDGASMPVGMDDCSALPKITEALVARGYRDEDIRKVLGGNTLRVLEEARRAAVAVVKAHR